MSSSWRSSKPLDVRNHDLEDDMSKEDDSSSSLGDPLSSSPQTLEATRRRKKKEKNKLARMMKTSLQDEERRKRFDGSFGEEESFSRGWQMAFGEDSASSSSSSESTTLQDDSIRLASSVHQERSTERTPTKMAPPTTPTMPRGQGSLNRGGARSNKVNSRLSQRSQRLLATYYESTEFVDSRSCTDESAGEDSGEDEGGSLIDDTKVAFVASEQVEDSSSERFVDEPYEAAVEGEKTGLAGLASRAASMVDGLSNKARFLSQRESTRADLSTLSSQRQRRRWQRFDEPGAVQMAGRAYGAPPRPPDAKETRVRGLSGSMDFSPDDQLLLEEGVTLTTAGPLVQANPVNEDECAPRALAEHDFALAHCSPLSLKDLFHERPVRRRLLCACILIALVIVAASGAATHFGTEAYDDTRNSTPATSPSPSPTYINKALAEDLAVFSGHDALSDPSSPQSQACGWFSTHDKSGLEPSDAGFVQRYVMVVAYYAMGGKNWLSQEKWLDPELHECEWSSSIHCTQDHSNRACITDIDLSRNGLDGRIPSELGYLDAMESINLSRNSLSGPIPPELFNIASLTELVLHSNILSSTIPSSISKAKFLDYVNLSENFLAGHIPDEIWDLTNLRTLNLSSNEFTGTISDQLENLRVLNSLDLRKNMLGGNIPDAISLLQELAVVKLDDNRLMGKFPAVTTAFVQLQEFTASHNFLSGTIGIPQGGIDPFEGLSDGDFRLQRLNIANNEFEGLIPEFVGKIPTLREFYFADNTFQGTYPSMPGMWRSLEIVSGGMNQLTGIPPSAFPPTLVQYDFHANHLTGGIPPNLFSALPRLEYVSLANNPLGGTIPSSLKDTPHLVALNLRECDLIGTIPDMTSLKTLGSFDIRKNSISGNLPSELGVLTALTSLKLGSNVLTGTICTEIGDLTNLAELLLEGNQLTGSLPDTLTNLGDLVEFRVVDNQLEGKVPEELCTTVEGLSVDHVGCDLVCTCCVDESVCGTS